MKKIITRMLFLILAIAILSGCSKDPIEDPKPITPSLTTSPATDKVVPIGCEDSISWNSQGISSLIVKINGEIVSTLLKGSIKLSSITEEKKVEFEIPDNREMNKTVRLMPQTVSYPKPTIILSKNPDRLPENGGSVTITWVTTNADSVLHNGKWYAANGSVSYNVTDTTTYQFTAQGPGGQVSDNITVYVETVIIPPPTQEEILCARPRTYVKMEYKYLDPGSEWIDNPITSCQEDNVLLFKIDHTGVMDFGEILCNGQTQTISHFTWTLENGHIFGMDIEYLSADTLIWVCPSIEIQPDGITTKDILVRETWVNQP